MSGGPLYRLTSSSYSSGETYSYSYDGVGNRLTMVYPGGTVNYTYDDANRLTAVGGQSYSWDDNGNLLSDGVRTYQYDHANRLKQVTEASLTTQFAYNGDGVRVAKSVGAAATDYLVDLATTLPVVISDTDAVYLYGLDILAEQLAGVDRYYYVHDGLGSVRQVLDSAGQIETTYTYDPFGVPLVGDGVPNPWQFTGEAWDAGVGLLYLRARYYQPETGRFIAKDPWPGDLWRPGTLNPYVYVGNNPVNYTDRSGLQEPEPQPDPHGTRGHDWTVSPGPGGPLFEGTEWDHRDLTDWLVEELKTNAARPETREISELLHSTGFCPRCWLVATDKWVDLVNDSHTWDFKHAIESKLRTDLVVLRHPGKVYGWYSSEVPGNINFGYVGRAADWTGLQLHLGATYAQVRDPSHEKCLVPGGHPRWRDPGDYGGVTKAQLRLEWWYKLFDNPEDYDAVEFGIRLYEAHPVHLTVLQFKQFLTMHSHMLRSHDPPDPDEPPQNIDELRRSHPYKWGYFNGPLGPPLSG